MPPRLWRGKLGSQGQKGGRVSRFRYMFLYSGGLFFELASLIVVLVVVGVLVNYFLISIIPIRGESMETNFHSGNWVVLNKLTYSKGEVKRGDVVGLKFPGDPNKEKLIKRVIGLPGETIVISQGLIFINSKRLEESYLPETDRTLPDLSLNLKDDQYYLIGDNRNNSSDSRIWGPASKKEFIGKVVFVLFPFGDYKYVDTPSY